MAKLLISLGCYWSDCLGRLVVRILGREPSATCVVLYYHSVPEAQRNAFARQMDIVTQLTTPTSIDATTQLLPGRRYCCITFDDGFEDAIDNAVPELQKRSIPATVFVTAGFLGQCAEWWPLGTSERQRRVAPAARLRQLPTDLISVGSHSVTHPYLARLSEMEAKRELCDSRVMLQDVIQRKISTFSFPYGNFNDRLVAWCREAGYQRVFTTRPGSAFQNANEFVTGRVPVDPTDWEVEFRLKLLGAYRWLPFAVSCKRKILSLRIFRIIGWWLRERSECP
jgi:peptidoglycan/xylan/chitin deacetylase (PgdA/CDA1 family)